MRYEWAWAVDPSASHRKVCVSFWLTLEDKLAGKISQKLAKCETILMTDFKGNIVS